jgi:coenzyme F420-reducing hydrogenase alpha subunit
MDPNFRGGLLTAEEHEKLTPETKEALTVNAKKQQELVKEMVDLVKVYCKKYPEEKICKFCNFETYHEYPYRLEQTIPEWIDKLDNTRP